MHQNTTYARRARRPIVAVLAALATLSACSDSVGPEIDGAPEPAVNFQRLLVTDAQAPSARLLALHNDSTLQTFTLGEAATRVYGSGVGRFGVIQERTVGRVHFVDGGVWTDGQRAYRRNASMLNFRVSDGRPSDENVHGEWMSVFFDASGMVRWFRESEFAAGNARVAFETTSGAPHHGITLTVFSGSTPFFAHSVPNDAGSPTGVAVRNQQGQIVAQVAVGDCPGVHGSSAIATGGVVGCNNGMVLVRPSGSSVTAEKITLAGDMAGLALRNASAGQGGDFILGQFAAFPGQPSQRVLAIINPATGTINRLPALPSGVTDHWRAVEPAKGQVVLLGTDGALYVYNGATRQLQHTVANVVPALTSGAMVHQVDVAEDVAAVASPTTGQVVLVNLATGAVTRRINVGGAPSRLALLGASRTGQYTPVR
jgi:hypothetical protein